MKRLGWLALLGICAYLVVWGVTWLAGDRSTAVFGVTDAGSAFGSYPGVMFGGPPPQPGSDSDLLPFLAAALGTVGIIVLVVASRRRPT